MSAMSVELAISSRGHSLLRRIRSALQKYWVRRQHYLAARALAGLSDYALKDMGIGRSEVHAFVHGPSADHRRRDP
jgi:uncharacterized protein YjiS (DUF1127 family)